MAYEELALESYTELKNEFADKLALPSPLRAYQWEGVSFLSRTTSVLLADEMGLGKTIQAIISLRILMNAGACNRVLIVTPQSLRSNWKHEFSRWAPELPCRLVDGNSLNRSALYLLPLPVLIATYEQVRLDIELFDRDEIFDVVLLDEGQRIKNPSSNTALACRLIPRKRSWVLTGTPVENSADDLISIYGFVNAGLVNRGMPRPVVHSLIRPFFLRRTKEKTVKDLPKIIIQDLGLQLEGRQRDAYRSLWRSRTTVLDKGKNQVGEMQLLALLTKLKQICNFDPQSGESVKLEALNLILENSTLSSEKIIVFSQYVETLRWLSKNIGEFSHDIFHGKLSEDEKDEVLKRFREEPGPRAVLISLKAGGVGLNLQEASTVVLFDRWWNPATEDQAIHRAHRLGRVRPLHVIRFVVQGTVEERIEDILRDKKTVFEKYINDATNADVCPLSKDDLWRILGIGQTTITDEEKQIRRESSTSERR